MYHQLGLTVISKADRTHYRKQGQITLGQEIVTLETKLAGVIASIAWMEEQVALTYLWIEEHGHCFARPEDWQLVITELREDLAVLQEIKRDRLKVAA